MKHPASYSTLDLDPDLHFTRQALRDLLALWQEKRDATVQQGRSLPDRADFTPFVLRPYLPRLLIYEIIGTPPERRFRIRLYGTLISQYTGRDSTGKFVDEVIPAPVLPQFLKGLNWLADNALPLRVTGNYQFVDRPLVTYESLVLPLTNGGDQVAHLLNATYYDDEK